MNENVEAFFYGLYMDIDLLKSLGFRPGETRKAVLESYALDLFGSAKVVPMEGSYVWGNIINLPREDLTAMYSFESTKEYVPETLQVKDSKGNYKQVSCYNLAKSDSESFNKEYHGKLLKIIERLEFPEEYIQNMKAMGRRNGALPG